MAEVSNCADRLTDAIIRKRNPSVIGLDPDPPFIPTYDGAQQPDQHPWMPPENGEYPTNIEEGIGDILYGFTRAIVDATHDIVPAFKPQRAHYERYGVAGIQAYKNICDHIKEETDCLIISDAKRNDIGNTARMYADAFLGKSILPGGSTMRALDVDALTVNAYLGSDGINPFIERCTEYGKGIFVLVKTSNKSAGELQDLALEGSPIRLVNTEGKTVTQPLKVYMKMAQLVAEWGTDLIGRHGVSSIGAVVGATKPEEAIYVRQLAPRTMFLVPGYGAQGGGADGAVIGARADGTGIIVNSSRGVLAAWATKDKKTGTYSPKKGVDPRNFAQEARKEAIRMRDDLNAALERAGKLQHWDREYSITE